MSATTINASSSEGFLDDAGVERKYGIRRGTLRAWRSRNQGPPYIRLTSKMVRYRSDDIDAWLAALTVAPGARKGA